MATQLPHPHTTPVAEQHNSFPSYEGTGNYKKISSILIPVLRIHFGVDPDPDLHPRIHASD
jgi:hypothetical protein